MENTLDYLKGSSFYQAPQQVSRREAEYLFQQMNGPVVGIERMTDEDLQKRLPPQFKLVP